MYNFVDVLTDESSLICRFLCKKKEDIRNQEHPDSHKWISVLQNNKMIIELKQKHELNLLTARQGVELEYILLFYLSFFF